MAMPAAPSSGSPLQPLPLAILPPLPLYRRLLRAHRKFLAPEMRILGDKYIKNEFRLHQKIENPMHIVCAYDPRSHTIALLSIQLRHRLPS